jgi:hypothetical protein
VLDMLRAVATICEFPEDPGNYSPNPSVHYIHLNRPNYSIQMANISTLQTMQRCFFSSVICVPSFLSALVAQLPPKSHFLLSLFPFPVHNTILSLSTQLLSQKAQPSDSPSTTTPYSPNCPLYSSTHQSCSSTS